MKKPDFPSNEAERQREVEKYQLLDTLPEECYDCITAMMAYICNAPISLVSILDKDRNFLKSHHGVPFNEDPRDRSFCGHAILDEHEIMVVADATKDERFHDNPLVSEMGVRFYAGAPLLNPEGYRLGTLCVFDTEAKELNEVQTQALVNMAKQVMMLMECHYKNIKLKEAQEDLKIRNEELEKFAAIVSHDLKSPLGNITGLTEVLSVSLDGKMNPEISGIIELMQESTNALSSYINGILNYYKSDVLLRNNHQLTETQNLFKELKGFFSLESDLKVEIESELKDIEINRGAITQILLNLITNGSKYNSKKDRWVKIRLKEENDVYKFEVEDNGDGISADDLKKIFELFETNQKLDRHGKTGTGIGLATVKRLIQNLRGDIWIESKPDTGTKVHFTLPKV